MNAKYAELLNTLAEKVNDNIVSKIDIEKVIRKMEREEK